MKIFIDADSCPVIGETTYLAKKYGLELYIVVNYDHVLRNDYGNIIKVDSSPESVDIYIFNHISPGDILVSQDLGLSSMAISKGALCIDPNGRVLKDSQVDLLLNQRHLSRKLRMDQSVYTKIKKRDQKADSLFLENLGRLIDNNLI